MKLRFWPLFGGVVLGLLPTVGYAQSSLIPGRVESVVGGDNLLVRINGELHNVDLANMYPPDQGSQNWDQLAAQRLTQLLPPGTPVMIDPAWESSGQLYAYVYGPEGLVNVQLIREGLSSPRGLPSHEPLQEWYSEAATNAETAGVGYWSTEGVTMSVATPLAALPARAAYWGLGGITLVATLIAVRHLWKKWQRHPRRQLHQAWQHWEHELPARLAHHKALERQQAHALALVQESLDLAELALRQGQEDQARNALIRKQHHQREADDLQLRIEESAAEVSEIRSTLATLQDHLQQAKLSRTSSLSTQK